MPYTTTGIYSNYSYNLLSSFFFFNDTATTEIYTLSLHDALPIFQCCGMGWVVSKEKWQLLRALTAGLAALPLDSRSEEHTSELQSRLHLVCRLLLEKKKKLFCALLSESGY